MLKWIGPGQRARAEILELRRAVLRRPLGLEFSPQDLAAEKNDWWLGLWDEGLLSGCLLIRDRGQKTAQMRQVAVAEGRRGRGLGRRMVEEAEALCRRRGFRRIILHAREDAVEFYRRLGYQTEGDPFVEIGLKHRLMAKGL
ncbi:MAG: GNAT family N-acetyltransferase [Elusimicrobia bacterium]|nr:GNAT family N-acetyltransferase [Elusimicrobiota bacterium]